MRSWTLPESSDSYQPVEIVLRQGSLQVLQAELIDHRLIDFIHVLPELGWPIKPMACGHLTDHSLQFKVVLSDWGSANIQVPKVRASRWNEPIMRNLHIESKREF